MKSKTLAVLFLFVAVSAMGRQAPAFRGELVSGERVSLNDYLKPDKGTLVCFWATWCVPCMEELRMINEKLKADPNFPVNVITVNVDNSETSSDVRPTIAQQNLPFPVILDPKHEIFSRFQQGQALPFSALVSDQGELAKTFEGLNENLFPEITQALAKTKKIQHAE
jgi:peroxiredoxin